MDRKHHLNHCRILLIGRQVDWNDAFLHGLRHLYVVHDASCEEVWQAQALLEEQEYDLIILATEDAADIETLRDQLDGVRSNAAYLVISELAVGDVLKLGADYCVQPADLPSAIGYAQMVVRNQTQHAQIEELEIQSAAIKELNDALYYGSPDPVCYTQDGLFMDANPAFLNSFGIENASMLHEITLLNIVTPRSEKPLKTLLRRTIDKRVTSSETLDVVSEGEEKRSFVCTANRVVFRGEPAIQLHWREVNQGTGAMASTDRATGLMRFEALQQLLAKARTENKEDEGLSIWVFLWLENYREVWIQDGYPAAEALIQCLVEGISRYLPPSTVATRFNDDILILLAKGPRHTVIERVEVLLEQVQQQVPEGVNRMVHPNVYALVDSLTPEVGDDALLSGSFRAVKGLSLSQSSEHLVTGSGNKLSRNDERRLLQLQTMLDEQSILVRYLPITHLEADGIPRFSVQLEAKPDTGDEDEYIEFETLVSVAERHNKSKPLDALKVNGFLRDVLCFDGDQKSINGFICLSPQSLADQNFPTWLMNQFKQTGIQPKQVTFEIPLDTALNGFTATRQFAEAMQKYGSHVAISEVGRMDTEILELLGKINPDVLKLDMREIDTFEDDEEERFMGEIKKYSDENKKIIIVDHMESPAQLSRVWPYDLQLLQGEGMVSAMENFDYDFSEPLF